MPDEPKKTGFECSKCGCRDLRVTHTRSVSKWCIRRYRRCRHCGNRIVTTERINQKK